MAEVSWIKITTDIFDDEKFAFIETLPEADSIIVIWFKLLALAGKSNNSGIFMISNKIPYTEELFAAVFRRPLNTIRLALSTFENLKMIEICNGIVTLPNWEKHQNIDGLQKIREKTRERVARYRANQKAIIEENDANSENVTDCNVTVTQQNKNKNKNLNSLSEPQKNYASIIFDLWSNNEFNLPKSKDLISFSSKEFRLALQYIKGIHSDDVIKAVNNYFDVLRLNGFYSHKFSFDKFAEHINQFLPDFFRIENYKDKQTQEQTKQKLSLVEIKELLVKENINNPDFDINILNKNYGDWVRSKCPVGNDYYLWQKRMRSGENGLIE